MRSHRSLHDRTDTHERTDIPGRSVLAQAAAEPLAGRRGRRRGGRRPGSRLDHPSAVDAAAERDALVLARGAAGPRIRSGGQPRVVVGRSRRRATNGRSSSTASTSTTRTTCGSRGGGDKDAQILKFTRQGKFLMQIGHQGKNEGSNDTQNLGGAANVDRRPRGQRAVRRRRLREPPRHRVRRRDRRVQAPLGRVRKAAGRLVFPEGRRASARARSTARCRTRTSRASTIRTVRRRRNSASSTPCGSRTTVSSTSAIAPTIGSRCFTRTGRSCRKPSSRRTRSAAARCGTSASPPTRTQTYLIVTDGTNQQVYVLLRKSLRGRQHVRRRRPLGRAVLRRAQPRDRLEGEPLHHRNVRRQARAEVQMDSHRDLILDQFTRQAIPFATAAPIRNQEALDRVVRMADAGPGGYGARRRVRTRTAGVRVRPRRRGTRPAST